MSPSLAPASISAAITSVYAVIASWTPWIVVSRSSTICEIDTFMTLLSSTITNCAAASTMIGSPTVPSFAVARARAMARAGVGLRMRAPAPGHWRAGWRAAPGPAMLARVTATAAGERRVVRHRYGLLLITLFLSLGVQGIAPHGAFQQIVVTALAGAGVALAVRAAGLRPRVVRLAVVLALLVLALSVVRATVGGIGEGAGARDERGARCARPARRRRRASSATSATTGQVRLTAVMGVLSLYLLLGMLFAFTYGAIDELGGDPFFAGGEARDGVATACTSASRR